LERYQIPAVVSAELVTRAQAGDTSAFEILYRQNVGRVYAICLRIVADEEWAEELTQQSFIRAWERLGSFRRESAFASWLHRLTVNVVLVDLRSRRRRTARVESRHELEDNPAAVDAASPETRLDLEKTIASLPEQARAILVLHDIEGYRHGEIAAMMEIAVGTSKAQLHRARKLLKERLQQ